MSLYVFAVRKECPLVFHNRKAQLDRYHCRRNEAVQNHMHDVYLENGFVIKFEFCEEQIFQVI